MVGKRLGRVAPPGKPGGWEARWGTSEAAKGWEDPCQTAQSATWEAWIVLTERPTNPENRSRHYRLKGELSSRQVRGVVLEQWQYKVTDGGRIWYCPDPERRIVWVVSATTGHPKATE